MISLSDHDVRDLVKTYTEFMMVLKTHKEVVTADQKVLIYEAWHRFWRVLHSNGVGYRKFNLPGEWPETADTDYDLVWTQPWEALK